MFVQDLFFTLSLMLTILFFLYGFNHYYLLYSARSYKSPPLPEDSSFKPGVSIHLPVYDEKYVIRRVVAACADMAQAYGVDKVNILVLDDSDDETAREVDQVVREYQQLSYSIKILRRANRNGFKAGALQAALEQTGEDFIAIFDADFVPPANFLLRTVPYFGADEQLGIVQSRWTHLNRAYNFLTRAEALGIDIHFLVEQPGRYSAGCFQNFNGSGGVLRKKAILQACGWSADTLAEDLDLSYRIQCQGYKVLYLKDLHSPGELPPTVPSFKKQQGRWANGSLRAARKILPGLLRDHRLKFKQRLQAFIQLTGFMIQPLMVCSFLVTCLTTLTGLDNPATERAGHLIHFSGNLSPAGTPMLALQNLVWAILFPLIVLCMLAPWTSAIASLKAQGFSLRRQLQPLFGLLLLGFGLCLSNTGEALKGLFTNRSWEFKRTPKYADLQDKQAWQLRKYQIPLDLQWLVELAFVILGAWAIGSAFQNANLAALAILVPFTMSFGFVFMASILQSRKQKTR